MTDQEAFVSSRPSGGRKVRLLAETHEPAHGLQGREGVTFRPSDEGTYVRFKDGAYVFVWWDEIEVVGE